MFRHSDGTFNDTQFNAAIMCFAPLVLAILIWLMNVIIRLFETIWIEFKKVVSNYPIPGEDAQWLAWCNICEDMELHVSRGGFKNGKIDHCYHCGNEKELNGFKADDIHRMKNSSKWHWLKITGKPNYPKLPYNWHNLSEPEKFSLLGMKK